MGNSLRPIILAAALTAAVPANPTSASAAGYELPNPKAIGDGVVGGGISVLRGSNLPVVWERTCS